MGKVREPDPEKRITAPALLALLHTFMKAYDGATCVSNMEQNVGEAMESAWAVQNTAAACTGKTLC